MLSTLLYPEDRFTYISTKDEMRLAADYLGT